MKECTQIEKIKTKLSKAANGFFSLFYHITLSCKYSTDCAGQVWVWNTGKLIYVSMCMCLKELRQLHLSWFCSSSCSNNLHNTFICTSGARKMGALNSFHFKFDLTFLLCVDIWHHLYFFACSGQRSDTSFPVCPSWSTISGCTTRRGGCQEGRWVSIADGSQAVILVPPSCCISLKTEGSCCRERLQSHVATELKKAGGGISQVTLHYTSTHFLRRLNNSLCVPLRPLYSLVHSFQM